MFLKVSNELWYVLARSANNVLYWQYAVTTQETAVVVGHCTKLSKEEVQVQIALGILPGVIFYKGDRGSGAAAYFSIDPENDEIWVNG